MKLVEFLYFYLMAETPTLPIAMSTPNTAIAGLRRSPSKLSGAFDQRRRDTVNGSETGKINGPTRTTEEKQALLGKYLSNVEDLVEDLRESAPFAAGPTYGI